MASIAIDSYNLNVSVGSLRTLQYIDRLIRTTIVNEPDFTPIRTDFPTDSQLPNQIGQRRLFVEAGNDDGESHLSTSVSRACVKSSGIASNSSQIILHALPRSYSPAYHHL